MNQVCLDGRILSADEPVLHAANKSYRYGDGLFETMKMVRDKIALSALHYERFFSGLSQLKYVVPKHIHAGAMHEQVLDLCKKNKCSELARIRLSAFAGDGGLYDTPRTLHYLIECWPANEAVTHLNENGLVTAIYPDARKSSDGFSNLKSANFLPYVMAAQYAKENQLNDCLVLNTHERIADATTANLFVVKDRQLLTPALSEGCVNGVMRRHLLEKTGASETKITRDDLLAADELFLTNAMNGIRWIKQFEEKTYSNTFTVDIYERHVKTIWE